MTTTIQTSQPSVTRQPLRSWSGAILLLLLTFGAGQACRARAVAGAESSQTHFLRSCSTACEAGLDGVCGVCTRPCELDVECRELAAGATCSPGAAACAGGALSCTVECNADADCRHIAGDMACVSGRCLAPALPATLPQGQGGPAAIGQACVTEDESFTTFSGFSMGEINIEGPGGSCGPELTCIVNRFQGRVTCPGGQTADELGNCLTPEGSAVSVPVPPQLESRPAERHVTCSCRCAGPDRGAGYCSCPDGMQCEELIGARPGVVDSYAGSYCTYPTAELDEAPTAEPREASDSP
jgi:hypothetical protein